MTEQEQPILERLALARAPVDARSAWSRSTNRRAYYRPDGYWNGAVWFPYQWFIWKALLDLGHGDLAFRHRPHRAGGLEERGGAHPTTASSISSSHSGRGGGLASLRRSFGPGPLLVSAPTTARARSPAALRPGCSAWNLPRICAPCKPICCAATQPTTAPGWRWSCCPPGLLTGWNGTAARRRWSSGCLGRWRSG